MNVLYILSGTEDKGGATKSFLAMANSVANAGNKVAVVVPDERGITTILRERGWDVLVVPYMFSTLPYMSWSPRDIIRFFPRLIMSKIINRKARKIVCDFAKKWKPDIVHDNTSVTDLGYYVARQLNIPNVIHIREYGWKDFRRIIPNLHKRLTAPYAYMIAITSALANYRGRGLAPDHVRVIYNGIVKEDMEEYKETKSPYFLYAGRIQPKKGVGDLIEAYIEYANAELSKGRQPLGLKLAGAYTREYSENLRQQISKFGLDDCVEWLGEVDDLHQYYSTVAATIIPSKCEGFGRVMPEASVAGSVCIVRNSGGLAEQLENGRRETGTDIAYAFDTIEDLAHSLAYISRMYEKGSEYKNGGEFFRKIHASKEVSKLLYSFKANAMGILDYYSYILMKKT